MKYRKVDAVLRGKEQRKKEVGLEKETRGSSHVTRSIEVDAMKLGDLLFIKISYLRRLFWHTSL